MLNKLFKTIITPIINQLPLCVFMYLLWGMNLFVSLHIRLLNNDRQIKSDRFLLWWRGNDLRP